MPVNDTCLPMHITALYVFTVINLTLLLNLTLVDANVFVSGRDNGTRREFYDQPAQFGPAFPEGGLVGYTVGSEPVNGCTRIASPPSVPVLEPPYVWIAVIQRSGCLFDKKVLNAQRAGYGAAIVYNVNGSSGLIPMGGDPLSEVRIPSCFVGARDGHLLASVFNYTTGYVITIDNDIPFDGSYYLFPLAVVLGICFILMLIFMICKWLRDVHKKRKSRLSKKQLNNIPTKKFQKGDSYDVCAVCLDDYEENQELRVLPCSHVYHIKCIDPWLLQNKPTCPICKRKVVASLPDPDDQDSDSDSADEDTPLIRPGASTRPRVFGATSARSAPSTINYQDITDSDDSGLSDYDDTPSTSHVNTAVISPETETETEGETARKSGLPDKVTGDTEGVGADSTSQTEITITTDDSHHQPESEPAPAGQEPEPGPSGAVAVVLEEAPAPLEPHVIVQNGRHAINSDQREFDGVV